MMALDEHIGGFCRDSQFLEFFFQCEIRLFGIGVEPLQLHDLSPHLVAHVGNSIAGILYGEMPGLDGLVEVGDGELGVVGGAVIPDAPNKQREYGERILSQVFLEVENLMVVERHHHTHVVERGREALVVFDGIDIGMEDVWVSYDVLRGLRRALHEEVVAGIHAGYHVFAHLVAHEVHEHLFLSLRQVDLRRQHHLEIMPVVIELTQHLPPKKHVVVTLYISHDTFSRGLASHAVDRAEIVGVEVVAQAFCHRREMGSIPCR